MTEFQTLQQHWRRDESIRIEGILPDDVAHQWAQTILRCPLRSYLQHDEHIRCFMWRCTFTPDTLPTELMATADWVNHTLPHYLSELTGLNIGALQPPSLPLAVFRKGSYLDTHNDFGNGPSIAWVLGLTSEPWTDEDGGCLEFMADQHSETVIERRLPGFNTLDVYTVFPHPRWHRVSIVKTHKHRVTISSWLPILDRV